MKEQGCGQCKWWFKSPPDPNNLGGEPQGLCRGGPPSVSLIPQQTRMGQVALTQVASYPTLPATYPTCRLFETRLSLMKE